MSKKSKKSKKKSSKILLDILERIEYIEGAIEHICNAHNTNVEGISNDINSITEKYNDLIKKFGTWPYLKREDMPANKEAGQPLKVDDHPRA